MIFLDTSAIYALANRNDPNHDRAMAAFLRLVEIQEEILLHSYVLVEAAALLQRRLGLDTVLRFFDQIRNFRVH